MIRTLIALVLAIYLLMAFGASVLIAILLAVRSGMTRV